MKTSESINEISTALAKAQGKMQNALKDKANPFFKSTYADLASVLDACRQPLSDNGLCVYQVHDMLEDGTMLLVTRLAHSSGQWIEGRMPMYPTKKDSQGIGSASTYCRRYALAAMVGIGSEDDDGNAACKPVKEECKAVLHDKKEKKISIEDIQLLQETLKDCSEDFRAKVSPTLSSLTSESFEKAKNKILEQRDLYQLQKKVKKEIPEEAPF